jgi:hypothetical protein
MEKYKLKNTKPRLFKFEEGEMWDGDNFKDSFEVFLNNMFLFLLIACPFTIGFYMIYPDSAVVILVTAVLGIVCGTILLFIRLISKVRRFKGEKQ